MSGISNSIVVTIEAQPVTPTLTISCSGGNGTSATDFLYTGGTLTTSCVAIGIPDGTTLTLNINGTPDPNTPTTTLSGGVGTLTTPIPLNSSGSVVSETITVSWSP